MTDTFYDPRCRDCGGPLHLSCEPCSLPRFGPFNGTRMLARSLMVHYEIDYEDHPEVVLELAGIIGEELLSIGREILTERGLLADEVGESSTGGTEGIVAGPAGVVGSPAKTHRGEG
jgi:hypothetical protein